MEELKEYSVAFQTCAHLFMELSVDFVGLAIQNEVGPDVRWHCAVGNLNDKYKRITVRYGKGIAGRVISSGSPMMIRRFPQQIIGKSTDYPIMLAEKLVSSYAVPLFFNGVTKGVLLIGHRKEHIFSENEQQMLKESALILVDVIKKHMNFQ